MNATDEISDLDHLYLLDANEPSDLWTEASQSQFSPAVREQIERGADAARGAQLLGIAVILSWAILIGMCWLLWSHYHG